MQMPLENEVDQILQAVLQRETELKQIDGDIVGARNITRLAEWDEIRQVFVAGQIKIYLRLIVYAFTLLRDTSDKRLLSQFKETLQQWQTWDIITTIQNHQLIKDYLTNLFQEHLRRYRFYSESNLQNRIDLDVIGLCAHLADIVTNKDKSKAVTSRRGPEAQSLLNLLQARLDLPMDPAYRPRHIKTLIQLSGWSGLFPECLVLTGINLEQRPIASGGCGDVYKGVLQGKHVAVKALRLYQNSDLANLLKKISAEAVLWRQLSHPNILPFYGIYHQEEAMRRLCLTSPWMENGNIVDFIESNPDIDCVPLVLDIAQGLTYLHSLTPNIIHGDLKGLNILITPLQRACLADFGLATVRDSATSTTTRGGGVGGTTRWQAPELMDPDETQHIANSKASDIYAFACVCYEMFSGKLPFHEYRNESRIILSVMQGKRPSLPPPYPSKIRGLSDALWRLVTVCWSHNPLDRPTADHVVERLRALPNRPVDQRPVDDFTANFSSQGPHHVEHPFSVLATASKMLLSTQHLNVYMSDSYASHIATRSQISSLHTTPDVPLDRALSTFQTYISPSEKPVEWVAEDIRHVNSIIEDTTLTKSVEIRQARIPGSIILFPRLIVYIFAHLVHCMPDKSLLAQFKLTLQRWMTWDVIEMIQNHQQVKDALRDFFQRGLLSTPGSHSEITYNQLLANDVVGLSARLTVIINDDAENMKLVRLRGPGAQSVINLLQTRLDFWIDPEYRPRHVKTLVELCKNSGLYPDCLILKGIEFEGDPVVGGGFGDVYKGRLRGQDIAIKVPKTFRQTDVDKLHRQFVCEAVTWRQLDLHPNILPFLVSPWMENGDVIEFLERAPRTDCFNLSLDVAQGLEYLHSKNVTHGNLRGLNILISLSGRACITNFGLATTKNSQPVVTTNPTRGSSGTMKWQAPELLCDSELEFVSRHDTKATDIYAFGMVCYEMFSGKFPFYDVHDHVLIRASEQRKRPARPLHAWSRTRGLNDDMWHLMERCWDQDPTKRPTASQIVQDLYYLPGRTPDKRPFDNSSNVSQMWQNHEQHPFSALTQCPENASWFDVQWPSGDAN